MTKDEEKKLIRSATLGGVFKAALGGFIFFLILALVQEGGNDLTQIVSGKAVAVMMVGVAYAVYRLMSNRKQ